MNSEIFETYVSIASGDESFAVVPPLVYSSEDK